MSQQELVRRLSGGIAAAMRSVKFCVSGGLPGVLPEIVVEGFGPLRLPLAPAAATRLGKLCTQAPFGKGTRTLVDKKVRNAFELSPAQFTLTSPHWDQAIGAAVDSVAGQLGLPADRLEPQLYKLLLYGRDGFFLPHRDSEKSDRMVASLIVALPSQFSGGMLTVRHQASSQRIDFKEAAAGQAACFAAFYADCEHEVSRVITGFRLCLAYNLVLRAAPRGKKPAAAAPETPAKELAASISAWVAREPSEPLVFALDHHYTERGLALDLLKGNDRATADLALAAAELAGCHACLCQVSRHILQDAQDGHYERRWNYSAGVPKNLELGEIYEDELLGTEWVGFEGERLKLPDIPFSTAAIVASTPLEQWTPTREEYEGYTGNAGNTLDRWYHRSALCVWHRDHHFDVVAKAGVSYSIDLLSPMVKRLAKTPKKRLDDARLDCIRLARAIIRRWPKRHPNHYASKSENDQLLDAFPALLIEIDDADTASLLLQIAASRDPMLNLEKLIVAYCRTHGCERFAHELTALFEANTSGVCVRDMNWLDHLAQARLDDSATDALVARLARQAAAQFCQPLPAGRYYSDDPTHAEQTLPALLRILLTVGDEAALAQVTGLVHSHPERFSIEKVQVPSLECIVTWRRKQKAAIPPLLTEWLRTLQQELSAATAQQPQPPADWARPAEIACSCPYCKQLNAILADPHAATGRLPAREESRSHLMGSIEKHECDATHKLEKKGSPYALVFTKTSGSFERRMKRFTADQKLLATVNELLMPVPGSVPKPAHRRVGRIKQATP